MLNDLWVQYSKNKTNDNRNKILTELNNQLETIKEYFIKYYSNPSILPKFKNRNNISRLIEQIKVVKLVLFYESNNTNVSDAWGYIYTNNLSTIFLNLYNFFNGNINASVYDTIVHELAHIIDFTLRRFGETPTYFESPELTDNIRNVEYITNKEEDYARVHRLRKLLNLPPFSTYTDIADSLSDYIKNNKISIWNHKLNVSQDKKYLYIKSDGPIRTLSIAELSQFFGNLVINEYLATDIGYLFAKYAKVEDGIIKINIVKIDKINSKFVNNLNGNSGNFA
jgi:hypothetical protein